jgi:hypothetical protein
LLRRLEPPDVADRSEDERRDDRPDARDRHQPNGPLVGKSLPRQLAIEHAELSDSVLQFVVKPVQDRTFMIGKQRGREPSAARFAKQVALVLRDQIACRMA